MGSWLFTSTTTAPHYYIYICSNMFQRANVRDVMRCTIHAAECVSHCARARFYLIRTRRAQAFKRAVRRLKTVNYGDCGCRRRRLLVGHKGWTNLCRLCCSHAARCPLSVSLQITLWKTYFPERHITTHTHTQEWNQHSEGLVFLSCAYANWKWKNKTWL